MVSITGTEFLHNEDEFVKTFGVHIIHQTWKCAEIPPKAEHLVESWRKNHPECLHILWTDNDNRMLVKTHYPQYLELYDEYPLVIHQVDIARCLYLHRYGGIYADIDYESKVNIFEQIQQLKQPEQTIFLVESAYLRYEYFQNSLMIALVPKHPIWIKICENSSSIMDSVKNLWQFNNFFTKKLMYTQYTLQITGPNLLDKTVLKDFRKDHSVAILPKKQFFLPTIESYAIHHQHKTWVDLTGALSNIIWFSAFSVFFLLVVCSVIFYYIGKKKQ
jgi:mannosyltransferase OCH1-like enzyme